MSPKPFNLGNWYKKNVKWYKKFTAKKWYREIPFSVRTLYPERLKHYKSSRSMKFARFPSKIKSTGIRKFVVNPAIRGFDIDFGFNRLRIGEKTDNVFNLDLNREQSFTIQVGDYGLNMWKNYPDVIDQRVKRQSERRREHGLCIRFGCPNKAERGYFQCKNHLKLDHIRYKIRKYGDLDHKTRYRKDTNPRPN